MLTAAHCLHHPRSLRPVTADRVHFVAGWRIGDHAGHGRAEALHPHPDFEMDAMGLARTADDIAVVEIAPALDLAPIAVGPPVETGALVTLVSYGRNRPEAPSIEVGCPVLAAEPGRLVLGCDVTHGVSGAPVLAETAEGPAVVAVISAIATWRGRTVALAVPVRAAAAILPLD